MEKEIFTESELMAYLGVSSANTMKAYREKGLRFSKIGGKNFYLFENVKKFMKENEHIGGRK